MFDELWRGGGACETRTTAYPDDAGSIGHLSELPSVYGVKIRNYDVEEEVAFEKEL